MKEFIEKAKFTSFCEDLKEATIGVSEKHFPAGSEDADAIYPATIAALGNLVSSLIRVNPDEERRREATELFIEGIYEAVTLPKSRG
jgi:hypothetical protein